MPTLLEEAVATQRRYYTETANRYERMHAHEGSGDAFNSKFVVAMLQMLGARSVLDVGTATGFRLVELRSALPGAFVCGVEPVSELLGVARRNDVPASASLIRGSGLALPFADQSFDVVCEFAILHHVSDPQTVVKEMLRVAKKAVLISDSNRFGQGSLPVRLLKILMCKARIWRAFDWLRTRGKGYRITEGDGLSYSYSVYDSYDLLAAWANRLIVIPADPGKARNWCHPLLNSGGVLALAIRESS
ncbi:MAG TPA: class I SAM-dependent methyltransferase [Candidatus Dormibacteraeota bacterium]|jgi:ubiquinone/menaquinone biosynthesis C-methylase UbiE|nr:class I SAM-dependent methyltransferase [Candidatus Dormibacteraeota bacterium]